MLVDEDGADAGYNGDAIADKFDQIVEAKEQSYERARCTTPLSEMLMKIAATVDEIG